jgi:hypothetical protein
MHEFILANLLFHVGAGTALMLIASSAAIRELLPRVSLEARSEAA